MRLFFFRLFPLLLVSLFLSACTKPDLTDTQGKGVFLKADKAQWTVINIWAHWCGPCREEVPELNALAREGQIRVLGYDFDNSQGEELVKKAKNMGIQFPVLTQSPLALLETKTPQVLPATMILNPQGKLIEVLYGPETKDSLKKKIRALMNKVNANG
ncbi:MULTISPECIES: TlpA disulfide reductase family protein [unclassified Endozoicomonas]|uniref:TlpA family protein disulfide reductase n=1 Tax=unclassified Endozoicomonas TaxID=2644528 RepID=UPI0021490FEA|nr:MULTISPECIES: TlpA disulfide reductase family protein [unclassified Endozoicomonas]